MKIRNGYGETKESHTVLLLCSIIANFTLNKAYRHVSVCVCVCVCQTDDATHYRKIKKALKYNALQGHMLPLVKILWAWERERKQRREKGNFWVAMLPTSLWLSLHIPQLLLFFLLSFNLTFPLHLLTVSFTQKHTQTLSLSQCKDACRTPRWFTCTPAIICEMCVPDRECE